MARSPRVVRALLVVTGVTLVLLVLQLAMYGWAVDRFMVWTGKSTKLRSEKMKTKVFVGPVRTLPVVLMHGMGDAAENTGMLKIRDAIAKQLQTHVVNIAIGDSVSQDVKNSYFLTMDEQLEVFVQQVRKDPALQGGFNAAGFSQGNLLIRGYIERYNDPPVRNFISFHGPLSGVGALPECRPTQFICKEINRLISTAVYSEPVQSHLAQSNYFRDPLKIPDFLQHAKFLPDINNEKAVVNATYKANFVQLRNLVLVRANADTQVFPKESEWFGAYRDGSKYQDVLGFNQTRWYREDLFGLQTLDRAGRVHFLETPGNHLQFTMAFLHRVISTYFAALPDVILP